MGEEGLAGRRRGLPVGKPGTAHNCEALLFTFTPAVDLPLHLDAILYVCFPTPWTLFQENLNVGSLIAQTPGTFSMGCELRWLPGIFRPFTYLCGVSGLPKTHEPTLDWKGPLTVLGTGDSAAALLIVIVLFTVWQQA